MKFSRGLAVVAAIPVLAACGNSSTTAQIPVSASYSPTPSSSSHSPTSSTSAPSGTSKASAATPAPMATQHKNAVPVVTPAPVHKTTENTPVQSAPAQNTVAPAASRPAASATHAAPAPKQSSATPTPRATATSHAITPGNTKAPVIVAPTSGTTKPVSTVKTPFTAAIVTPSGQGSPSTTKRLGNGTWRVYITAITSTSVTVQVLGKATGNCTDDCLEPIATQTIPLASINVPTVMPLKTSANMPFQGITAPAWVYAEIFNQGQAGLNKAVADGHYAVTPSLKAKINPAFATAAGGALGNGVKSVYSNITIQNGVVSKVEWTYHP